MVNSENQTEHYSTDAVDSAVLDILLQIEVQLFYDIM